MFAQRRERNTSLDLEVCDVGLERSGLVKLANTLLIEEPEKSLWCLEQAVPCRVVPYVLYQARDGIERLAALLFCFPWKLLPMIAGTRSAVA